MDNYFENVTNSRGIPVENATVTVYDQGTLNKSSIFSDDGVTPASNPLSTNELGYFRFYAANGAYDIKISGAGIATDWRYDIRLNENSAFMATLADDVSADTFWATLMASLDKPSAAISFGVKSVVSTVALLKAETNLTNGRIIFLVDGYRGGSFEFDDSDLSTEVAADTQNGIYIPPNSDTTGASGAWKRKGWYGPAHLGWFGYDFDGSDAYTALVGADTAGINSVLIPEDASVTISTKFSPTAPLEIYGASRSTSKIVCDVDNDYAIEVSGPSSSTSRPILRNLTVTASGSALNPKGVHLFDNAAREISDIDISGALVEGINFEQCVQPILRNVRASGGQGRTIIFDNGSTATVNPIMENVYIGGATTAGIDITGSCTMLFGYGVILESCAIGIRAESASGKLGAYFESNTKDWEFSNCAIELIDYGRTGSSPTATVSYGSLQPYEKYQGLQNIGDRACGGMYNNDARTPSVASTWETLLFGGQFSSPFVIPNPGGASYGDIQIVKPGLYEISYSVTFWASAATAGHGSTRLMLDPTGTPTEIQGSYGDVYIPAVAGATGTISRKMIVELDAGDVIRFQYGSTDTSVRVSVGTSGLTPTNTTNANITIRALGFTADTTIPG